MKSEYLIQVDGSHIKGLTAVGVTVRNRYGEIILEFRKYMGPGTCNTAEYDAVYWGLQIAKDMGLTNISIQSDSKLIINQVIGNYQVYSDNLKACYKRVWELMVNFNRIDLHFKNRKYNENSDRLAKSVLREYWKDHAKGIMKWIYLCPTPI